MELNSYGYDYDRTVSIELQPGDLERDLLEDLKSWEWDMPILRERRAFGSSRAGLSAGWPIALRRALNAEAEVRRLKGIMAAMEAILTEKEIEA